MADRLDAIAYHELTKHSVASVRTNRHFLDWDTQPTAFKVYSGLQTVPLPRDFSRRAEEPGGGLDRLGLARLLHFTGGIMRKKVLADGSEHYFRAAACTGALYHIDLYLFCSDLPDVEAGVYHFGLHDFALHRLRRGDHRGVIVEATGDEPAIADAPAVLVCTSTFWRNAWKYEARTYRHCFWDSGTMLANLLAVAVAAKIPAKIVLGFADETINEQLGLDTKREVALACVALGRGNEAKSHRSRSGFEAARSWGPEARHPAGFRGEVDYPAIRAAHAGSSLDTPKAAQQWREHAFGRLMLEPTGKLIPLAPPIADTPAAIEEIIARRGSARRFARQPVPYEALSHILHTAIVNIPADFSPTGNPDPWPGFSETRLPLGLGTHARESLLNDVYIIVNDVDGLPAGAYVYRRDRSSLELLKLGDFRHEAGHLDLGQELAGDASVNFYLLSDLGLVVARLGNRGYRAAALEAAILGGRIYLAAYGLGLGATGLTFYDDEVTDFFSPHAAGKGVMFLTAVGRSRP